MSVVRTLDARVYCENSASPHGRQMLLDEQARLEMRFAHAQKLVESESFNLGHRHALATVRRRDLIDAQLSELHQLLHEHDGAYDRCRSYRCNNFALPRFQGSGYCETCLHHAIEGTAPPIDPTAPAPALVGSPWGA